MNRFFAPLVAIALLAGCDKLKGGAQTSYCEAVCDWAVSCTELEREIDREAEMAECLSATQAADSACADAENGDLNAADSTLLTECTDAIESSSAAGDCDAFTGNYAEQEASTTPAECASQGGTDSQATLDAAQGSTAETNEEMCERFSTTFCEKVDECLQAKLGEGYTTAVEATGTDPVAMCEDKVAFQTTSCSSDGLYNESEGADVNTARETARECLGDLTTADCDALLSGNVPATCAGAFTDTDTSLAFGQAILETAQAYGG
jgi:hypothetical protein